MRVLVTGGAGYVGSVSVEALVAAGHDVLVLDDLSKGHRDALPGGVRLVQGSYGDPAVVGQLLANTPVDAVLHCAARSLVGESVSNPALYYRENVAGGVAFLEVLREAGVRRLVFSSTAAVYGTPASVPIREDAVLAPINPYGETKRTFEGALRWYAAAYGLRSVSLRYFNVAGASERNGEVHAPETHLIPNVLAAAEGRAALTVFGIDYPTPDGTCIRDYLHVEDLARAHVLALEATSPGDPRTAGAAPDGRTVPDSGVAADRRTAPAGGGEPSDGAPNDRVGVAALAINLGNGGGFRAAALAINLGNGGGFSVREVLSAAETVVGSRIPHAIGERRAGDPPVLVADAGRADEILGWRAQHRDIVEIVASAWSWRQAHPDGYRA
jgi:UDP-glucose 4-epimerase